jgi:MFS family permease
MRRLRQLNRNYPRQFWVLFWGLLVNASGNSMVWPFLTIYLRQKLEVPLTTVTLLLTLNSVASLASTFIAGPIADRFGRKGVMVVSMITSSIIYIAMIQAGSLQFWAILMALSGAANPIFRVGSNSMVADIVPEENRPNAYALLRMITNLGVSIGPSVGGFIAAVSYSWIFAIAATTSFLFTILIVLMVAETMPDQAPTSGDTADKSGMGYTQVLRDRPFLAFCGIYSVAAMAYVMMMVLLPVYGKENFGVIESQYGFIMATNALMVVLFQYSVTNITKRYPDLLVMAVGALFYALGVGSIALGWNFFTFLGSMIILTIGELIAMPTSLTLTANMAPPEMRGRYMGIYSLTFGIGIGVGPVIGGFLNDNLSPVAIWYGGMTLALLACGGFVILYKTISGSTSSKEVAVAKERV